MRSLRAGLVVVGFAITAVGVWLLLDIGVDNLIATVTWLLVGVVAHDALLAPVTIGVVVVASRFMPAWLRSAASVGFVVLGTVTVLAIPVLGRFGAREDNPSLLDRDYTAGWVAFALIVVLGVVLGALWQRHSHAGRPEVEDRR